MWVMRSDDRRELEAYRELGSVEEVRERMASPYPSDDGYAQLPMSDPAMACVEANKTKGQKPWKSFS